MTDYALSFDGVDDYVEVDNFNLPEQFSIIVFGYIGQDFDAWDSFIQASIWTGTAVQGANIYSYHGNAIWFDVGNGTEYKNVVSNTLEKNRNYMFGLVYDGSSVYCYVNNQHVGSKTVAFASWDKLFIGWGQIHSEDAHLHGKVYAVLIYSRALSDEEIQQIYNDPLNPPTDGLVLWFAPDSVDVENGVWHDKSGNGNDGTIYGATYIPITVIGTVKLSDGTPVEGATVISIREDTYDLVGIAVTESDGSYSVAAKWGVDNTVVVIPPAENQNGDIKCHIRPAWQV